MTPTAPSSVTQPPPRLGPGRILLLAAAFALWTGLVEVIPVLVAPLGGVMIRLSRHVLWMAPAGNLAFFGVAAAVLMGLGRAWPAATSRPVVLGVFSALSALALGLVPERLYPPAVLILAVGVGVQVARMTRRPARWPRLAAGAVVVALLLIGGLTARAEARRASWERIWRTWLPAAPADAPNVVLIILDTVRGASLSFLDDLAPQSDLAPVEMPVLDSLGARGLVFTRAVAPSPWTLPSHASMFTGRWPLELWPQPGSEWSRGLDTRFPTVAEVLARRGYLTAAFVGNLTFATGQTGLGRGFLEYRDYRISPGQILVSTSLGRRVAANTAWRRLAGYHELLNRKDAGTVTDEFLSWLGGHGDRPYFAFINFFDAHEPVFPPDSMKATLPAGDRWDAFDQYAGLLTGTSAVRSLKWDMSPGERAAHAAGYHDAVRALDSEIGRLLREVEARSQGRPTVVILASDHGEQLGEHGLYHHNNSLYLPALHVPLLVLDPRLPEPAVVREVVSLRDVAATILERAGADPAAAGVPGRSLARYAPGGDPQAAGEEEWPPALATLGRGVAEEAWYPIARGPAMYALLDSTYHYILNGDGVEELYDHRIDPAETANLASRRDLEPVLVRFRTALRSRVPGGR